MAGIPSPGAVLRGLLKGPEILIAPGAHNTQNLYREEHGTNYRIGAISG